jgi:hypothetical protein
VSEIAEPVTHAATKLVSTLQAALALKGHQCHVLATGGFLVLWQGHSRHCGDLDSLEAFARQVGAIR